DHAEDLALPDGQVHTGDRREPAEPLGEPADLEERMGRRGFHHSSRLARTLARKTSEPKRPPRAPAAGRRKGPIRPRGRKTMKKMMIRPSTVGWSSRKWLQT